MAEQNINFNLNEFSYEGAGKTYEVLAKNAGQKAEQAGMDKRMHAQEAASANSRYSQFLSAANSTRSQAGTQLANATARLHGANVQSTAQTDAYNRSTSIQIGNALGKVGEYYKQAEVDAKTLEGATEGMKLKADLMDLKDRDPEGAIQQIEAIMADYEMNPKDPYLKNVAKQVSQVYMPARGVKEDNRIQSNIMAYASHLEENDGVIGETDRKAFAKTHNMDVAILRDVEYNAITEKWAQALMQTNTKEQQTAVNEEYSNFVDDNFNNNYLLKSKSPQTQKMVTQGAKKVTTANTTADKRILNIAKETVTGMRDTLKSDTVVGVTPETADPKLREASNGNPETYYQKKEAYQKEYDDQVKKVDWNNNVWYDQARPEGYELSGDHVEKDYINGKIADVAMPAFNNRNVALFQDYVKHNTKEELEHTGKYIMQGFTSAETADQLTLATGNFMAVVQSPGGSATMRKFLKDEDFGEILMLSYATSSIAGGDIEKARRWVEEVKGAPKHAGPTTEMRKTMQKRATQLGRNYNMYSSIMHGFSKFDPALAKEQEQTVSNWFNDLISQPDGASAPVNNLGIDTIETKGMNKQRIRETLSGIANGATDNDTASYETTKEGNVLVIDSIGGISTMMNPDVLIQADNNKTLVDTQAYVAENGLPLGEVASTVATTIGTALIEGTKGAGQAVGNITSKLSTHIYENDKEFFDGPMASAWEASWGIATTMAPILNMVTSEDAPLPKDAYKVVKGEKQLAIKHITPSMREEESAMAYKNKVLAGLGIMKALYTTTVSADDTGLNDTLTYMQMTEANYKNKVTVDKIEKIETDIDEDSEGKWKTFEEPVVETSFWNSVGEKVMMTDAEMEADFTPPSQRDASQEPKTKAIPIKSRSKLDKQNIQKVIGEKPDGVWGKNSQAAYDDYQKTGMKWQDISKPGEVNPITGLSGTIAKRNNNPGAMKLEFANAILGRTISSSKLRSRGKALRDANRNYDGVVTLDRAGFIIFDSIESGRAAQNKLLINKHGNRTVSEMLPYYAIDDGSGKAHHKAYAKAIYKHTTSDGFSIESKKIGNMSNDEVKSLAKAMARVEGGY